MATALQQQNSSQVKHYDTSIRCENDDCASSAKRGVRWWGEVRAIVERTGATTSLFSRGRILHDTRPLPAATTTTVEVPHTQERERTSNHVPGLCCSRSGNLHSLVLHFCTYRRRQTTERSVPCKDRTDSEWSILIVNVCSVLCFSTLQFVTVWLQSKFKVWRLLLLFIDRHLSIEPYFYTIYIVFYYLI